MIPLSPPATDNDHTLFSPSEETTTSTTTINVTLFGQDKPTTANRGSCSSSSTATGVSGFSRANSESQHNVDDLLDLCEDECLQDSIFCDQTDLILDLFEELSLLWETVIEMVPQARDVMSLLKHLEFKLEALEREEQSSAAEVVALMGELFVVLLENFREVLERAELLKVAKVSSTRFALFVRMSEIMPIQNVLCLM